MMKAVVATLTAAIIGTGTLFASSALAVMTPPPGQLDLLEDPPESVNGQTGTIGDPNGGSNAQTPSSSDSDSGVVEATREVRSERAITHYSWQSTETMVTISVYNSRQLRMNILIETTPWRGEGSFSVTSNRDSQVLEIGIANNRLAYAQYNGRAIQGSLSTTEKAMAEEMSAYVRDFLAIIGNQNNNRTAYSNGTTTYSTPAQRKTDRLTVGTACIIVAICEIAVAFGTEGAGVLLAHGICASLAPTCIVAHGVLLATEEEEEEEEEEKPDTGGTPPNKELPPTMETIYNGEQGSCIDTGGGGWSESHENPDGSPVDVDVTIHDERPRCP